MLEQRREAQLCEGMDRLKQENQALLADLQLMKRDRELAEAATGHTTPHTLTLL